MEREIKELQEALNVLAQVCDQHVDTPANHRKIAESLKLVTDTLSKLLKDKLAVQEQK